ncbi:hypothetical protein GCM10023094_43660 [Rhodococcus olei]|uniref:Uncharacterized protein n=1 Tax=Rhodococcus olei TaxID=2161675 RepID=A0ABP8PIK6_9NOCA
MSGRGRSIADLGLAVVALVAAVWCWSRAVTTSEYAPIAEGAPAFTATHYSGPWIAAASAAVIVAGLAVLDAWRRR